MLDEIKKTYQAQAELIPNWRKLSKSELCNLYIENESVSYLRDRYFSAIILKYWPKIYSLYSNTYLTASYEDVYNWIVEGILYALKHRRWLEKDSNIYNDPAGPDKAINRKIKCIRLNHLIGSNRLKRAVNVNILSLDSFENPENLISYNDFDKDTVSDLVCEYWQSGFKTQAILIDLISSGDCYYQDEQTNKYDFSLQMLFNCVYGIDEDYIKYFSDNYGIELDSISSHIDSILYDKLCDGLWGFGDYLTKKSFSDVSKIITEELTKLSHDNCLREMLR